MNVFHPVPGGCFVLENLMTMNAFCVIRIQNILIHFIL